MTKGPVSLMPAPAMSVGVIALAVTAGMTLQILANHRLTGRPTPVSLALTWAMSTTGAWIFAVLLSLFLAGLAVRIRLVVPRAAVLIMLAVLCVTIAVTARALVDTLLPSTVQQGLTGVDLWIRYFVRWSGPGMLVALAVVALPTLQSRLTVGAQPEATPSPSPEATTGPLDVVVVRIGERSIPVALSQVHWIGAAGNYAELHGATGHHLARITMSDLERRLDPARFVRVHRSAIVALPSIRAVRPRPNGSTEVVMVDGTVVPLSRVGRKALEAKMGSRG